MEKLKIAFVCVGNSCRSQMAEAFAKKYGKDLFEVYSAGTHPTHEVNPTAIKVMREVGIDLDEHYPKLLKDIPEELDVLITMGCNVVCPFVPNRYQEDWGLEDPVGKPIEDFRRTRDIIEENVKILVKNITKHQI